MAETSAHPVHPVEILHAEHRVILRVLDAVEAEAQKADPEATPRRPFWDQVLEFLGEFADARHHGKEEDLLFPAMEAAGLPAQGPTGVMRQEHVEGRDLRSRMAAALEKGDPRTVIAAARAFVHLLREHILKEDQVLFPMARELVTGQAAEELRTGFAEVEKDHELRGVDHRALVDAICARDD